MRYFGKLRLAVSASSAHVEDSYSGNGCRQSHLEQLPPSSAEQASTTGPISVLSKPAPDFPVIFKTEHLE